MLKIKKLFSYLALLVIPIVVAVVLFFYTGSGFRLSEQEASSIAYQNAGVSASEVNESKISKVRSGLHGSYEIHFSTADNQFSYTIDGQSGSILKHDNDMPVSDSSAESGSSDEADNTGQSSEESPAVSKEAAQTAALNHAGLSEASVTNITTSQRDDSGTPVYDVSFDYAASGLRYKYTINAQSGAILGYTTEYLSGAVNTYSPQ